MDEWTRKRGSCVTCEEAELDCRAVVGDLETYAVARNLLTKSLVSLIVELEKERGTGKVVAFAGMKDTTSLPYKIPYARALWLGA
jgi:hypothetical protein